MGKLYTCTVCGKKKQKNEFYLRDNGSVSEYKCKLCIQNKRKTYYNENYEEVRASNRKAVRKWQKKNLDKEAAKVAKYSANKKQAVPSWVDNVELSRIKSLYKEARRLTKLTGNRHEIDHIVPLNSDIVCGLHTLHNLRICTKEENLKKSNRIIEDIVCTSERSED